LPIPVKFRLVKIVIRDGEMEQRVETIPEAIMPAVDIRKAHRTREPEMLLKNKVAVIYGAGGAVGSAVGIRNGARVLAVARQEALLRQQERGCAVDCAVHSAARDRA
jgi:hypothetical protein